MQKERRAQLWCAATLAMRLAIPLGLSASCEDGVTTTKVESSAVVSDSGVPGAPKNPCAKAKPGATCGDGMHCIDGACTRNVCGDGVAAESEGCDDGNQVTGDGCTPSCELRPATCGDATLDDGEECDDGNWFNDDPCSNDCTSNKCGNAREDGFEECDDGNLTDDDACSVKCLENRCRNGRLDPGEECDDGNQVHDDGCSNGCLEVVCGNGKVDDAARGGREECDDGNAVNADACANACTANQCGNARIDPGEVCDGATSELSCSDDCKTATKNDACRQCREAKCGASYEYEGNPLNVLQGCLGNDDALFRQQCTGLIDCAKANACGYNTENVNPSRAEGVIECFCGSVDLSSCQVAGRANGPCQAQTYAAGRSEALADTLGNAGDVSLPLGMANYLLECERSLCKEECVP